MKTTLPSKQKNEQRTMVKQYEERNQSFNELLCIGMRKFKHGLEEIAVDSGSIVELEDPQ
jgi:hypothetical protein